MMARSFMTSRVSVWWRVLPLCLLFLSAKALAGQTGLTGIAVWVTSSMGIHGEGGLEELLLDRLGSNGLQDIREPDEVQAAGLFVGLGDGSVFNCAKLGTLGRALKTRWVVWVKVVDRGVDYKKGLSIPHLFIRRKAVSHLLVDARVVDVATGRLAASQRFRMDKSGAGSYQVADDVRQDPVYNNSVPQFYQDARRLEWQAARDISAWFKWLVGHAENMPAVTAEEGLLDDGPFTAREKAELR
jgi:hypothetical protein